MVWAVWVPRAVNAVAWVLLMPESALVQCSWSQRRRGSDLLSGVPTPKQGHTSRENEISDSSFQNAQPAFLFSDLRVQSWSSW